MFHINNRRRMTRGLGFVGFRYTQPNPTYGLTIRLAFKWLNRRSQKKSYNWEQFNIYLFRYPFPKPKIYHNLYTLYGH